MNIFSEKDVPESFWELAEEILQTDAVKQEPTRGPPKSCKASSEYWRPNLTKAEWSLLNRTMDLEIGTSDKYIDRYTKWTYANQKGVKVFAIYGIGDGSDPTPLFAVGGIKASVFGDWRNEYYARAEFRTKATYIDYIASLKGKPYRRDVGNLSRAWLSYQRNIGAMHGTSANVTGFYGGAQRKDNSKGTEGFNAGTAQQREIRKASREFISAQMTEQEKYLQKVNRQLEKENAKLQEDKQYLKQLLKIQKEVTGGTKYTRSSVEAMARLLKAKADAKGDTKELASLLNSFYEFIASSEDISWEAVMEQAEVVADWLLNNKQEHFVRDEYAQRVLDDLKGRSFHLDESQKGEAIYAYGSYQAFRLKVLGNVMPNDNTMKYFILNSV